MQSKEVDLVYLWVDGNDPEWRKKKEKATGNIDVSSEVDNEGRYKSNDELKYSLRSAEKYAPWVRKIFIVTDNQIPEWLNPAHPKIQIVDHTEILPATALPCFNAYLIEVFLHRIKGLSERFLYANDDMFFNAPVDATFFFEPDDFPIVRMKKEPFSKGFKMLRTIVGKQPGNYQKVIQHSKSLVESKFGVSYPGEPHHNIDAYLKSDFRVAAEEVFSQQILPTLGNHVRTDDDISRFAFSLYALAKGRAHAAYVNKNISLRNQLYKRDFAERMEKYRPRLFCMNDNQKTSDDDREAGRRFLERHFPTKSSFEK